MMDSISKTNNILEKHYGIKFLTYRKFTADGMLFHVSSEISWLDCALEHDFLTSNSSIDRLKLAKIGKLTPFLWPQKPQNDKTYHALFENNFWNGITVYEKFHNQVELWAFFTTRNNESAPQIYINNFEIIERFIQFFKQKHFDIISNSNKKLLLKTNVSDHLDVIFPQKTRDDFLEETKLEKFVIKDILGNNAIITAQEAKCIFYLSQGNNMKMIGQKLNLSSRTVEGYINQAKIKLKCVTRNQLVTHISNCILDGMFL